MTQTLAERLFRRRSIRELHADGERSHLKRALGPLSLVALGVGAIIGAGIFGTIGQAAVKAGPAVSLSFVVTAVACAFAGLCYAELTSVVPIAGSAYTYAYATLGELVAWVIGWDLILEYAVGNVGVAISWADYAYALLHDLGVPFPIWLAKDPRALTSAPADVIAQIRAEAPLVAGHPICFNLLAVSITAFITVLLVRGVKESASFNNVIVALKLGVLLFVIGVGMTAWNTGLWGLDPFDWNTFAPNGWRGIFAGAGLLFFSYIGFDAVSTAAEEARNPGRDLPIGILGSLGLCTVLYIVIGLVVTALVPYTKLGETADPLNVAIEGANLPWAKLVVSAGATLSMTAVLLVFQMGQPRIWMSMSRDGLLPPLFARVHPKYGTPAVSTILTGLLVAGFSAFANIEEIVNLVNIGTLFAFVIVCAGTLVLRVKEPDVHRPFRVRGIWFVAPAGIVTCVFLMTRLSPENWSRLALWFLVGLNGYFTYGFLRTTKDPADRARARARACAAFAVLLTAAGAFLLFGDDWLSAVRVLDGDGRLLRSYPRATDAASLVLAPGEEARTLWEIWIGFPSGFAHGIAVFLAGLALWNLWGVYTASRRVSA